MPAAAQSFSRTWLALSLLLLHPMSKDFDERRAHQRTPASELKGVHAKLTAGPGITLLDLSRSGVRFTCDTRLSPRLPIAMNFVTPDGEVAIRGQVVRSQLILDQGRMVYEIAVAFSGLLPDFNAAPQPAEPVPPVKPAVAVTDTEDASAVAEDDLDLSAVLHLTASVPQSMSELRDMFNGNNW